LEFLTTIPPGLHYLDTPKTEDKEDFKDLPKAVKSKSTCTKCGYTRKPPKSKACHWDGFTGEVLSFPVDNLEGTFDEPFRDYFNIPSENRVQMAFDTNAQAHINNFFRNRFPDEQFNVAEGTDKLIGKPDFVLVSSQGKLLLTTEMKTKWVLNVNLDIVGKYSERPIGR